MGFFSVLMISFLLASAVAAPAGENGAGPLPLPEDGTGTPLSPIASDDPAVTAFSVFAVRPDTVPLAQEDIDYICSVADRFSLPPELIFGVIYAESRYTPDVISPDGGNYGIMQINKVNFGWLGEKFGVTDFLDLRGNVLCGAYLLSLCSDAAGGDTDRTLMCYRYGETGAKRAWAAGVTTDAYCGIVRGEMERIRQCRQQNY